MFIIMEYSLRNNEFGKFFLKIYVEVFIFCLRLVDRIEVKILIGFIKFLIFVIIENGYILKK